MFLYLKKCVYKSITNMRKVINRVHMHLELSMFKSCGTKVIIASGGSFSYDNIIIGNKVYIGPNAIFRSTHSNIIIMDNVMFGPNVVILGGDHRTDIIGEFMIDVKEKNENTDKDVIIENDVWIGANVTILKGVRIGEGSIIGAASVVTKDVPPFSVYTGVPSKKVRQRWEFDQIKLHKEIIAKKKLNNNI
ncbi:acyltransferase [Crassaminicella thermophila]|uniref:Acyltransferase n=1 Tax=Crassaminicella thermophila TaxID=2599308 RepID=A0A5C0SIC8_CRATE|nr:acyltransferase [Crassaminicella thermophila]QEK13194.1 acyltransferase [Crassaminicella thermophila]